LVQAEHSSDQGIARLLANRLIRSGICNARKRRYLILDAEENCSQIINLWEALKRALKSKTIKIEHPYADMGE